MSDLLFVAGWLLIGWLLIGWLLARWMFSHLGVEDGEDLAMALFIIVTGPVGTLGVVLVMALEGQIHLPGARHADWAAITRRVLAL